MQRNMREYNDSDIYIQEEATDQGATPVIAQHEIYFQFIESWILQQWRWLAS